MRLDDRHIQRNAKYIKKYNGANCFVGTCPNPIYKGVVDHFDELQIEDAQQNQYYEN